MATVVHRTTVELRESVHSPDYPVGAWIHNPNLSALASVPQRYWKVSGDSVLEMTQAEKDAKDAADAQAIIDADRTSSKVQIDLRDLVGVFQVLVDEINLLRAVGQRISFGGFATLTNIGLIYDGINAAKGLGAAIVDFTGVSEITFGVSVNKVGTGTQSWQLWNVTDGSEIAVIEDAGLVGDKVLQVNVSAGLPTGVKLVRVRAKSSVVSDDPIYYGGALVLKYPARTYAQARASILNRIDSL